MPQLNSSALHLPPAYLNILKSLLKQHVPNTEVWAYGSRVFENKGDYYEASDLDLVVRNPNDLNKENTDIIDLQDALIASDIPIQVQVVDWARIPAAFHSEIEVAYVSIIFM